MRFSIQERKQYLILSLILFAKELSGIESLSTSIDHDTIRRIEGVPCLGRGYSVTTNTLLSSCLEASETTMEHSYNYKYYYTPFVNDGNFEQQLQGDISNTLGYKKVKEALSETININRIAFESSEDESLIQPTPKRRYTIAVTMRVERSFSTLVEHEATLSAAATQLIEKEEYASFFMTCGPNYVRSLHHAQEVTAIFTFEEADHKRAEAFAESLRLYVYGNRGESILSAHSAEDEDANIIGFTVDRRFDDTDVMKTLSIELLAYGLGLNKSGSDSLATASLDEFNSVMRFAFDSMIKSNHTDQCGTTYEMEVVPWTDNIEFLKLTQVLENAIAVPTPHGLIENAKRGLNNDGVEVMICSDGTMIDHYGKCCDEIALETTPDGTQICQPSDYLSSAIMRANLELNAEFVSWLGSVAHDKLKSLSTLSQCVNAARTLPKRFDYFFLESNANADFDNDIEMSLTLKELKAALDPTGNLDIVNMVGKEIEEFMEMFYQPCISALYGMNDGEDKDTDPKFFLIEPWYKHKECTRHSCMEENMAWDRINGNGCVDGLLIRKNTESPIPAPNDPHCAISLNQLTGHEECKYKYPPDDNLVTTVDNCREKLPQSKDGRGNSIPLSIADIIDYFCMPQLAFDREQADPEKMDAVDDLWETCVQR